MAALRLAFPELGDRECRRLARASFEEREAAVWDALALGRFEPRGLCRRLTLNGWPHLGAAERLGSGVLVVGSRLGRPELATLAVGLYRDGIDVLPPGHATPAVARELARLAGGYGLRWAERDEVRLVRVLRAGGRVGLPGDLHTPADGGAAVDFLGGRVKLDPLAVRLCLGTGAPLVPIFGFSEVGGGYRVVVKEPLLPEAQGGEQAAEQLTRRYLEVLELEIRRRPELWPWVP